MELHEFCKVFRFHLIDLTLGPDVFTTNTGWLGFTEVGDIRMDAEVVTIEVGNTVCPFYGVKGVTFGSLVLKKGVIVCDNDFSVWLMENCYGVINRIKIPKSNRKNLLFMHLLPVNITTGIFVKSYPMLTEKVGIARATMLYECIPKQYTLRGGQANASEIAIAELEIQPMYVEELAFPVIKGSNTQRAIAGIALARLGSYLANLAATYKGQVEVF